MTSLLNFTPLSTNPQYYASILSIDSLKILLDCGLNNEKDIEELQKIAPQIALCLITHPTVQHTNAIQYLNCPVYATTPTKILAKIANEQQKGREAKEEKKKRREAFERIVAVKFEQIIEFVGGKLN